jgi:arylsulfatase A-like enzyme
MSRCVDAPRDAGRWAPRPNIIFIFADDWGWGDLSCHGHPWLWTPNIDRLAAQGTDFNQFTVASGVCSPSRAAVLTGHFPARHCVYGHFATVSSHERRAMQDWLDPQAVLLPRLLQGAGYATAHFGKWHLTNVMVPDAPSAGDYGYDAYGTFNGSGEQMPVHEDVERSIAFVEQSAAAAKPFFLNLWIHEPHTPFYPLPEYMQQFDALDEPAQIYAATLAHADARIGQLLATLDRLRLADDTLVIFSSDNGPEDTHPGQRWLDDEATGAGIGNMASVGSTGGHRGRKRSLLQGGVGVPFIAKWPGRIAAGEVDDRSPLTAVDLLPTFCALAGVALPAHYAPDGVDQSAVLCGQSTSARDKAIFWEWREAGGGDNWPLYAMREGCWKLLVGREPGQVELYRFPEDRLERQDLSGAYPEVVQQMQSKIEAWAAGLPRQVDLDCCSVQRSAR